MDRQIARFKKVLQPPVIKLRYPVFPSIPATGEPKGSEAVGASESDPVTVERQVTMGDTIQYLANLPVVRLREEKVVLYVPSVSLEELAFWQKAWVAFYNDTARQMEQKWCMKIPRETS